MTTAITRRRWRAEAACLGKDPDLFYRNSAGAQSKAIAFCRGCPVVDECLLDALATRDEFGVRGGKTHQERLRMQLHGDEIVLRPEGAGKVCAYCRGPVAAGAPHNTRYCSNFCRRAAALQRAVDDA